MRTDRPSTAPCQHDWLIHEGLDYKGDKIIWCRKCRHYKDELNDRTV